MLGYFVMIPYTFTIIPAKENSEVVIIYPDIYIYIYIYIYIVYLFIYLFIYIYIWRFPKIEGVLIHFMGFSIINHPDGKPPHMCL